MQANSDHFLLYTEATRSAESAPHWKFMLQSVSGDIQLSADDSELNSRTSRLELLAVVRGLEAIDRPARVTLLTGSRYVSHGIRRQLSQWREDNWQWERFGEFVPIRDKDLWQRVDHALKFHQVECSDWQAEGRASLNSAGASSRFAAALATLRRGILTPLTALLANDVYSGRLTAHNNTAPGLAVLGEWIGLKGFIVQTQLPLHSIAPVVYGYHENPFEVLGPHEVEQNGRRALAVRAYLPEAQRAWVVDPAHGVTRPMRRIHPAGLYEAVVEERVARSDGRDETNALRSSALDPNPAILAPSYQLRVTYKSGETHTMHDPYAFPPMMGELDLHLLGEGQHWKSYEKLGAQLRTVDGIAGVNFAVWRPNAESVAVVGDFNMWDRRSHQMRKHVPAGVWELFVPGIGAGTHYKFAVKHRGGHVIDKCDPYGYFAEVPPRTANIVTDLNSYKWKDSEWVQARSKRNGLDAPISVYEMHLGSWRRDPGNPERWLSYGEIAPQLVAYCKQMGFTHVQLLPVSEHPFTGSWGYQTTGYFAATSRYGTPQDFMAFVDLLHQNDLGVIIDWVPAHFPKDDHGLRQFDGTALYEHSDPQKGEHPDWGTLIFNYGRNEVKNFLLSNALFWLDKYHIDGLRVDAVASMLYLDYSRKHGEWQPNMYGGRENLEAIDLLKKFNEEVHLQYPGVLTIAEESTAWAGVSRPTYTGGLGFSLKWNMGWMNDTRQYFHKDPIHRKFHQDELTFSLIYAFTENFCLPMSHDEVVHGKGSLLDQMPGDLWQKFANLRLLYGYMWAHPGKKLLFMGAEFGQWKEWNHDDSLQWDLLQWQSHEGIQRYLADLNALYKSEPSLHEIDFESNGFEWVDCHNWQDSILVFLRKAKDPKDYLLVCCNFTPVPRPAYKIGVPEACWYEEVSNSDSTFYGGSDLGNGGGIQALPVESHGRPASMEVSIPPLATVIFKPRR